MKSNKLSRRDFISGSSLAAAALLAGRASTSSAGVTESQADAVRTVVRHAGNLDSDQRRLELLRELQQRTGLDASIKQDLTHLISQIDRWLHEQRLDYFG